MAIFAYAWRVRFSGGVIGIGNDVKLVDGTAITVPQYALYLGDFGWGVENHGVDRMGEEQL